MNQFPEPYAPMYFRALIIVTLFVLAFLGESFAYRRYTGLSRWQSVGLGVLAAVLAGICVAIGNERNDRQYSHGFGSTPLLFWGHTALLPLLAVPFIVRLYHKWIGGQLTDAEKLPGMDGVRAWLGFGNLICAMLIPICAWRTFGVSLPAMFALTFGLLLAYPVFNLASAAPQPAPAGPTDDLSAEREKVLQLLEAGKITADESADLLNALGQSVPRRPFPAAETELSPQRKIVLLGAALLLIGFILPWFVVNPGAEANEIIAKLQEGMQISTGSWLPHMNFSLPTGTAQVHAGDLRNGLGWWVLLLGIGAAVLPFFATTLKAQTQKKVVIAALAIGAFLLVYLLSMMDWPLGKISMGFILALAGYSLEIVGTLKERPAAR